jgi:hypothetical protein
VSEDKDIKRFKREVAAYLDVSITYANAPDWATKDQFDVVIEAGAFKVGNGTALCTNRMKTRPFEAWLKANAGPEDIIYYGFDPKETARIQRRSSHLASLGFRTDYPLALWKDRTIADTEAIGIYRPNTYSLFKHGNCVGCLKAGRQHWYAVYCTHPDRWEKGKFAEEEIGYTIIKGTSLEALEPMFGWCPNFKFPVVGFRGKWWDVAGNPAPRLENRTPKISGHASSPVGGLGVCPKLGHSQFGSASSSICLPSAAWGLA